MLRVGLRSTACNRPRVWIDPVLLVALALASGAFLVDAPLATALGALGVAGVLRRHLSAGVFVGALVALGMGCARAHWEVAAYEAAYERARSGFRAPERCALEGRVASSPVLSHDRIAFTLSLEAGRCESLRLPAGIGVRLGGGPRDLARGDRVSVIAQIAPIELLHNPGLADPRPFAARRGSVVSGTALDVSIDERGRGPSALIDRARAAVRERILATFAPAAAPLARALVLGENDLDEGDAAAFAKSGLAHLLAVSGTHLVFAVVSIVRAFAAVLVRIERLSAARDVGRAAAVFGMGLAPLYADFAGGSGSAWRAAWMLMAAFAARALGRIPCASRALALSVLTGWVVDPLVAFDVSFLLSAAATAGLLVLGGPLARPCERLRSRPARAFGKAIATTLAAMAPCAPLLAMLGSDLTLAGVFANVIAAPFGELVALPLCLAHAVTAPVPLLEQGVALVASGALLVVRQIAHESAAATWLAFGVPDPNAYQLALCAPLFTGFLLAVLPSGRPGHLCRAWVVAAAVGLGVIEVAARRAGAPEGELRMTALAVGQGDATLVDLPDGSLMLVDAGGALFEGAPDPGERVVVPVLRARRRERIDVLVVTHPHPDHAGGVFAVLDAVSVGEIWLPVSASDDAPALETRLLAEAARRNVPVRGPRALCGRSRAFGGAVVRVLAPCPDSVPGRSINDNSLVVRVELGERALLLMGDAEHEQENALIAHPAIRLRADVLKVGHHGSRTSTSEVLVARVAPRVATVSCGVRNRFGHPSPEVVERLTERGVRVLRTDRHGAIHVRTDGRDMWVGAARPSVPALVERLRAWSLAARVSAARGSSSHSLAP